MGMWNKWRAYYRLYRRRMYRAFLYIKSILAAIHQKSLAHPVAKVIAGKLVGWAIIGMGIAVAQWDEYGLALGLFLCGSIVLLLQAYNWEGFKGYKNLSKFLQVVYVLGALVMLIAAYPITKAKRGDKPWSDTWHRSVHTAPQSPADNQQTAKNEESKKEPPKIESPPMAPLQKLPLRHVAKMDERKTPKYRAIALSDELFKWMRTERERIVDFQEYEKEMFRQYHQKFEPQVTEITENLNNCGADTEMLQKQLIETKGNWHNITFLEGVAFELKTAAHSIPDGQPECGTGEPTQGFGLKDTGMYTLLMGRASMGYYKEQLEQGKKRPGNVTVGGLNTFKPYLLKGNFCIDAKVYGGFRLPLIEVTCNHLAEISSNWDTNYTDKAIEVVDQNEVPVFQMIFESDTKIRINGVFPAENNEVLIETPEGTRRVKLDPKNATPIEVPLKRLFKYPAYRFLHQYAD